MPHLPMLYIIHTTAALPKDNVTISTSPSMPHHEPPATPTPVEQLDNHLSFFLTTALTHEELLPCGLVRWMGYGIDKW